MSPPLDVEFPGGLLTSKKQEMAKAMQICLKSGPFARRFGPLAQRLVVTETRTGKSFVIDISGMCSQKRNAKDGSHLRWQTEHNIQKMKSKEFGFSKTKCIKSTGKQLRHDGLNSRSSPIEPVNPGQVTFEKL